MSTKTPGRPAAADEADTIPRAPAGDAGTLLAYGRKQTVATGAEAEPVDPTTAPTLASGGSGAPRGAGSTISVPTVLPSVDRAQGRPRPSPAGRARYEEEGLLGAGGLGEVVAARDNDIMRTVAIKRLLPGQEVPGMVERFVDEIRTVGRLEHPNIVPVHDVGRDDAGKYYFVMKHVKGETLESIIRRLDAGDPEAHAVYTFERRTRIFIDILEAVGYAHAQGIIHRDIKPANIMIGQFGEVVVMDWGIARDVDDQDEERVEKPGGAAAASRLADTEAGGLIGTPAYMSPEQARGRPLDVRSDIYSLCVMFHEMLCLRHYLADRQNLEAILAGVLEVEPGHPSFIPHPRQGKVPADLGWFVLAGLEKDPARRYPSIQAMRERLQRRDDGHIPVQCPITFTKAVTNAWERALDAHPTLVLGGAAMAILTLLGAAAVGVVLGASALLG